ncbi:Serine/threonine-protein kinase PLK [Aphelenchoides bicaudatus]|nr:Serine/threonine-protein kinase PLK [Aphelenchoides bicaudatus]
MSQRSNKPVLKEVPELVNGKLNHRQTIFKRGKFLGKGGFARCYELFAEREKLTFAGKVISKQILTKKSQKDKVMQEIMIHAELKHPNIVRLEGHFEDIDNVYVLLELCPKRSLMELHKRRRTVTEPEARYFVNEIVNGCQYLHNLKIIHRDLKLGNLFLNEYLNIKIGDFGLATKMEFDGQKKLTLCGTPNYIAPEMLLKAGHSYSVDIWAIGCILFTLLVGKPPFETESLKQTYSKIRHNEYSIPKRIGQHAHNLISALLAPAPENRPNIHDIPNYPFFTNGFMPVALPASCLNSIPRFNNENVCGGMVKADTRLGEAFHALQLNGASMTQDAASMIVNKFKATDKAEIPTIQQLASLAEQLAPFCYEGDNLDTNKQLDIQDEDPASAPMFWVAKWVDYSNKYGLSYQLSDDSVGVIFNDGTKILVDPTGVHVQYMDAAGSESFFKIESPPNELDKKFKLLSYFRSYMHKHLLATGAGIKSVAHEYARFSFLDAWFRTNSAIDHTKIILCPNMNAVTYIEANRDCHTYQLKHLAESGCSHELFKRLKYAKTMVDRMCQRLLSTH